ncbi:MAG: ABC transporter ATP-binding protein [Ndongobacter sp.]|nr:ABC transporter ATP-binding protein [Ndongobacter sp.]
MLKVNNITAAYGGIRALDQVSIEVGTGEIVSVLGANGAGKTTLLKCISAAMPVKSGDISFMGKSIPSKPYSLVKEGLIHVPEGRLIFPELTVEENLTVGGYLRTRDTSYQEDLDWVYSLFPILRERRKQYGGHLSGGEQQMLAIGRGIMGKPKLILFDEPSLGLAPLIVNTIFEVFDAIRSRGISVLLVEQNAYKGLEVADRAYVLSVGRVVREEKASVLIQDRSLIESYLGG